MELIDIDASFLVFLSVLNLGLGAFYFLKLGPQVPEHYTDRYREVLKNCHRLADQFGWHWRDRVIKAFGNGLEPRHPLLKKYMELSERVERIEQSLLSTALSPQARHRLQGQVARAHAEVQKIVREFHHQMRQPWEPKMPSSVRSRTRVPLEHPVDRDPNFIPAAGLSPLETLGLLRHATKQDVRRASNLLLRRFHPDHQEVSGGLDRKLAHALTIEVLRARKAILNS